jgi:BlaI family penicillinase repressor
MASHPQISDAEWEVMKVLWEKSPISVSDLSRELASTGWHQKTIRTMVIRLARKGVIDHQVKDGVYHYSPLISKTESLSAATRSFVDRVFDGALAPMIAHFAGHRRLSAQEKSELKKLLADK